MSKKLEIGDEFVIYPEGGYSYVVTKDISGINYEQEFSSLFLPEELIAVCIGREDMEGVLCDKYILKEIPEELEELCLGGESGFINQSAVLDSVAGILRGKAKDGRKIKYVRSVTDEDINKLFNVTIDFKGKKVYQEGIGKNINEEENFGNSLDINLNFSQSAIKIIRKHIKGKYIDFTSYYYTEEDLQVEEYLKKLVFLKESYYLNSPGVCCDSDAAGFGPGGVDGGYVFYGNYDLFDSDGYWHSYVMAVRPIFYLEKDK